MNLAYQVNTLRRHQLVLQVAGQDVWEARGPERYLLAMMVRKCTHSQVAPDMTESNNPPVRLHGRHHHFGRSRNLSAPHPHSSLPAVQIMKVIFLAEFNAI